MLSLRVSIGPGAALLALLVVTSIGRLWVWCCLLVKGLEMLLIVWIYQRLPLLIRIVAVVRHLNGSYDFGTTEVDSRNRCNVKGGDGSVDDFSRKTQPRSFEQQTRFKIHCSIKHANDTHIQCPHILSNYVHPGKLLYPPASNYHVAVS